MAGVVQALDGVKIVLFGAYAAGPHIGKILANYGATVVHVESRDRPDGFRLQYPPFKGRAGLDRSACFSYFNDSKYAVTLNLKAPDGMALAHRLVRWGDVVVENMRPGVMARLGLGYEQLVQEKPDIIMLSTCNMGQTGPRADQPGFGSQLSALAGFCGLTGDPQGPPMLLYGPYIDFIASSLGSAAVLAALDQRHRTGKGAHIDVSQYEGGVNFIAGAMFEYFDTGRVAERAGNEDRKAAPHGAYLCEDEAWLALSCWNDDEFATLATLIGDRSLASDARFADAASRRENRDALDDLLGQWCASRNAEATAIELQAAGIRAHPVTSIAGLFSDPQLTHRKTWRKRRHPVIGDQSYYFPGFDLSKTPGEITGPAPLLAADNYTVYREFLGLSEDEYDALCKEGAID
jgi:benzylsuccinate CoA-transferase BbsF subunit